MSRAWFAVALAVASCSGGAGGDTAPALTFSPATLRATYWEGDATRAEVSIGYRNLSGQVSIRVVDAEGILQGEIGIEHFPQSSRIAATVHLSTSIAAGVHTGSLEVWVCRDSPAVCADAVQGSPWRLPYEITVRAPAQGPLAALPGAAPWSTYQGNAGHTGYVPAAALVPVNFTRRWTLRTGATAVATDGGRVFATTHDHFSGEWRLRAIDEDTGQELWSQDLGALATIVSGGITTPGARAVAAAGGRVFVTVTSAAYPNPSEIRAFDQVTGDPVDTFAAGGVPTPLEGAVYGDFGVVNAVGQRLELPSLAETWAAHCDPYVACVGFGTPAVDAERVWTVNSFRLEARRRTDGTSEFIIEDQSLLDHPSVPSPNAAVLGPDGTVCFTESQIRVGCWDTVQKAKKWIVNSDYRSDPVIANGMLYVVRNLEYSLALDARNPATGTLTWSESLGSNYDGSFAWWTPEPQVVVVGNLAFATTVHSVVAVDVQTHRVAWSHPVPGKLAVSEHGVLYIASPDALYATNLAFVP